MDAAVCPGLIEGLESVQDMIRLWYYQTAGKRIRIEIADAVHRNGRTRPEATRDRCAGSMFSSGVDSLAMLRHNHLQYPPDHPWHARKASTIIGQNIESDMSEPTVQQALIDYSAVTADLGVPLIPVYTNIRSLETDGAFFRNVNHGAIMASVAHIFSQAVHTIFIASSDNLGELAYYKQPAFAPWGSHPSSASVYIRHESLMFTRLDRLRTIAGWEAGLQNIRVCGRNWPGQNCGKCDRCVRTKLGLLVLGVLDKTRAFAEDDVTEDDLRIIRMRDYNPQLNNATHAIYHEFVPYLERMGRHDLVRGIKQAELARRKRPQDRLMGAIRRMMGWQQRDRKRGAVKQAVAMLSVFLV